MVEPDKSISGKVILYSFKVIKILSKFSKSTIEINILLGIIYFRLQNKS